MDLLSRDQWGARRPKKVYRIPLPTPRLWIHHTATEQHGAVGVRAIQAYHMDTKRWNDIAYSFLVDDDGTMYEGRGVAVAGGHTEGDNTRSHAICLMGNLDARPPTPAAINAVADLARYGRDAGWWVPTLGGHRDAPGASTACPGRYAYDALDHIRWLVDQPATVEAPPLPPIPEEDDMYIITNQDQDLGIWVLHGEMFLHLASTDTVSSMLASGVKAQVWDDADFKALIAEKGIGEAALAAATRADLRLADIQAQIAKLDPAAS